MNFIHSNQNIMQNIINTSIWQEDPDPTNPFGTNTARCRGYDVFNDLVGNASWIQMLVLLFRNELPEQTALKQLEALAVGIMNPGPRDPSVHAGMCGGVGKAPAAASLIAALSVGAGRNNGSHDVHDVMTMLNLYGHDLEKWTMHKPPTIELWPDREITPGFDPHSPLPPTTLIDFVHRLYETNPSPNVAWLHQNVEAMRSEVGTHANMAMIAACVLVDLGFTPDEGEMLHLLFRLPGAAAHSLEQSAGGFKQFPFGAIQILE
jgi:citrate synthase